MHLGYVIMEMFKSSYGLNLNQRNVVAQSQKGN